MGSLKTAFNIVPAPKSDIPITTQRKRWLREFMKTYAVLIIGYGGFYLLRTNFKSAQPFLRDQLGLTTTQLGTIGFGFSLTYGFGGLILGFFADGHNTKKIISALLIASGVVAITIGITLAVTHNPYGYLILLWSLTGLLQSPGGPCCNSTMNRWTPRKYRGRFIGWWNASHNLGAMAAGALALWGANTFFHGSVVGFFVVPALVAIPIGIWGLFFGKDDPIELGWDKPEVIFGEPQAKADVVTQQVSKGRILMDYVVKNPAIWFLCIANVAAYVVRIGIDNWNVLYTKSELGFSDYTAVNTTIALEIGGLLGSLCWGFFSDRLGGRRALTAAIGLALVVVPIFVYAHATTPTVVYAALFFIGFLIFGPVTLIGISVIGFAPKTATVVVNAVPRAFGYVFGDSIAKVLLGRIADPKKQGLEIFGHSLHGWGSTFTVLFVSAGVGLVCLVAVALFEERMIRADREFSREHPAADAGISQGADDE
ncbi:hexose-6-phosphate:phosphate antiporter [Propionibacterium freudenreichii]|uniref:hexose-6-phosphate:phosphate antiporter n=1 Tax=Propionibacterium freudenreichii TaxID=1744 RepID=UPI0021A6D4F5|nr:hexose-6-phosphate:phosphate antiporter [Propionibacterium freudenreichii]MCT2972990.1 hexose-6-phosphate:phosphate antiporter [Propionibacterium freudenreichii]MCT2978176.1 hexose-6-phosphate:phosphate antiporter [Propionibacterium freudenreichii]MCT2986660.1 hexose-6-phosphate:phosphate antiporter [Propionibacterium freudenreichii]MCT2989942.1 hexose-6-phosphate:phosphate antiporter [Propionibacterium freudenreichii]MCT3011530.1 hexose-6-phosphate:phosphate antiporter [Propionibacterium f